MKLLLTSSGLTNPTIVKALEELLGKSLHGVKMAFVPTAANVEEGDKSWLTEELASYTRLGFVVDVVDISELEKEVWLERLTSAQVLFFGGGNTFHLMHWMNKSGLAQILPELLGERVFAGTSAGSCIAGPTIKNPVQDLFEEGYEIETVEGLHLVDFQIVPHLNSDYFEKIRVENLQEASVSLNEKVYAVDDESAIVVNGDNVKVVSEGEWHVFNEK